ncbi:arabinosyltransferase domain-containing protein [Amycolatopsis cihanbeyliensis]|uniref:EmbC-like arabinotransferase in arabinogalactan biosynthesis n=1 Tax=Amycolatopsis cihanbeyliensis TaxID=1128664 RepID=A0A542DBN7_AMYCI|nr:arabinosyltransferase domain-containing protein [Amycolatopsis cihanbeyliensis]TQJ00491.1 EmbC-like arabinotransferase in arabinogalactan biosynthesis [Amycolatopsis cihanbeyliensis]
MTDNATTPRPVSAPGSPARSRHGLRWLLALAFATIAVAVAVPFAPVESERVEVRWPEAGQSAESAVAMFMPYRPLRLDVTLACAAVAETPSGQDRTAFATIPPDADIAGDWGLSVVIRDRRLALIAGGTETPLGSPPGTDCRYRIHAENDELVVLVSGPAAGERELARIGTRVPHVTAFVTDLPAERATGAVSAVARADARFQTSPGPLKLILMLACGAGVLGCVVLAFRTFRGPSRPGGRSLPRRADIAWTGLVTVGIAGWGVLGPQTVDDGWFLGMHRNLGPSGFAGDYYMALNAAENPAVLLHHLFAPLFQLSWAPLVVRSPAMAAGVAMWLLLLGIVRLLRRHTTAPRVPTWLLAAAFFTAWMPHGVGLRPEPFVALCTAISGYAAVRARLTERPAWLLVAGVAAGVCFAVTSTGMLALIPLALGLVHACRHLPRARERFTLVALSGAAVAVAAPLVFLDSGIGGFLDSTGARYWYGAAQSWHGEFDRYQMLLGGVSDAFAFEQHPARRLPILLAVALLLVALALAPRRQPTHAFAGACGWPFAWFGLGLAALVVTPTKIASHFAALDFLIALVLALGLAALPRAFASENAGWAIRFSALFLVVLTTSLAWNGPNAWWGYHRLGMPALDEHLFDGALADPLTLLAIGTVFATVILLWHRHRGIGPRDPQPVTTRMAGWSALAIAGLSLLAMPVVTAGALGKAALNQHARDSWSPPAANLAALIGSTCGAADHVRLDDGTTLTQKIARTPGPVLVDWPISFWYPCARLPVLADGLVEPPTLMITAPGQHAHHGNLARSYGPFAGAFAGMGSVATYHEIPARLTGNPDPRAWGTLHEVRYRYPANRIDVHVSTVTRNGWHRGPGYATTDYIDKPPPNP